MQIFKATFYSNVSHKIEPIICIKITDTSVVIPRSPNEIKQFNSNKPVISRRELNGARYCETEKEAIDYLDSKYQEKIEQLSDALFSCKKKQKSLLGVS